MNTQSIRIYTMVRLLFTKVGGYIHRVGLALSVLFNVITGGASNQTFSARNWHWRKNDRPNIVWLIDGVLGHNHCMECWVYWKVRESKW